MKIKIFSDFDKLSLEKAVNDFIADKKVISIDYKRYHDLSEVLVVYDECVCVDDGFCASYSDDFLHI